MLLTKENKEAATHLVENNPKDPTTIKPFPDATRKRILNSTVQLDGSSPSGAGFKGSGVIINVSATDVTVLTALHNVYVWFEEKPGWINKIDSFAAEVGIWCPTGDMTFNGNPKGSQATIRTAQRPTANPCTQRSACLYDLLVLTSRDAKLMAYAKASVFANQLDTIEKEGPKIVESFYELLDSGAYYHVQLGYGDIQETRQGQKVEAKKIVEPQKKKKLRTCGAGFKIDKNNLHYRIAIPNAKATCSRYNQESNAGEAPSYTEYAETISFVGKAFSTTAPGDSGGPVYAVDRETMTKVYLLGVTTGVDMQASAKPNSWIFKNCLSTSVVPYLTG